MKTRRFLISSRPGGRKSFALADTSGESWNWQWVWPPLLELSTIMATIGEQFQRKAPFQKPSWRRGKSLWRRMAIAVLSGGWPTWIWFWMGLHWPKPHKVWARGRNMQLRPSKPCGWRRVRLWVLRYTLTTGILVSRNQTWIITRGQHGQTICKNLILQLAGPCCPSDVIRLWFVFAEYGVQLGVKVPLWGGFSAHGGFALKLWTQKAKMDKEQWAGHIPALKSAASQANNCHNLSCWKTSRLCSCLFLFSFGVCFFVGLCCHSIKALGAKGWRCGWTTKGFSK